jgi:serine/threonine protein kinase
MAFDQRVFDLVLRYKELQEQGQSPTPKELCRDCPELLPGVQHWLAVVAALPPADRSTTVDEPPRSPAAIPSPGSSDTTAEQPGAGTRYRPLRLHARGGLGEVHLAHDEELHREVALKRMKDLCARDPDSRRRFLLEAEVTARLEHPGIVPVYGLVQDDAGQPCYAMRFIEGQSLKEALQDFHKADVPGRDPGERTLALRKLLGDFVSVCKAVGYAHSRDVVHRDLKPANIMLGTYGEVLVVDWGLAKKLQLSETERAGGEESVKPATFQSEAEETRLGRALGTPAYMSPEQAAGRWDILRPASDIFSLGATLYALLTGRAPFQGRDTPDILAKVQRGEFPPPRQVKKDVPPPLEAICCKAMALQPQDRYETALDLAADVERWLADEPVTAYREPLAARLGRWLRHHQTLTAAVGALLLTGVIALAISTVLVGQAQQETADALQQEEQARKDRALAQVDALLNADPQAVPALLAALETARADVLPRLHQLWAAPEAPHTRVQRGRVGLALLPVEPNAVRDWLVAWMLQAPDPREMVLMRDGLKAHGAGLPAKLWAQAEDVQALPGQRFRALAALAVFDRQGEGWSRHAGLATQQLLGANPLHLATWMQALQPVRRSLLKSLAKDYHEAKSPERREFAATVLVDYAAEQPKLLADLLLDADPRQFASVAWRRLRQSSPGRALRLPLQGCAGGPRRPFRFPAGEDFPLSLFYRFTVRRRRIGSCVEDLHQDGIRPACLVRTCDTR